ncbi:hypothetical protein [Nucisporomicrobium flavum]|uniref:hypothetical protein n=1 Tax=Nucisporomicrobium flavum TaxID=2785915 RepID=UPI0018F2A3D6|nr:hypothetical protein [Nucisporomicrobium flavum]
MSERHGNTSTTQGIGQLSSERDARLEQVGQRAQAAGLNAWWTQFRDPATGRGAGPWGMRVDLQSGPTIRSVDLSSGEEAAVLLRFPFERWTALRGYEAIFDPGEKRIIAAVTLRGTSLSKIPGVLVGPPEDVEPVSNGATNLRLAFQLPGHLPGPSTLTLVGPMAGLTVELQSQASSEVGALRGRSTSTGQTLVIRGVSAQSHDEAHELLEDMAAAVFIELDRNYGLAGTLQRTLNDDLVEHEYDQESISPSPPRLPASRYGRNAAALYLYARTVPFQLPVLEYLGYYQVIEHYMAAFSRATMIKSVSNMLADPEFDHHDEMAVDRLIGVVLPGGRNRATEREQVRVAVAACLDDAMVAQFLDQRPAAAKALRDASWIAGVRVVVAGDVQVSLVRQIADRIYDLRCRIVHGKENHAEAEPLRPFGPEVKRLRHDLHLVRFVAQCVLVTSSKMADWS